MLKMYSSYASLNILIKKYHNFSEYQNLGQTYRWSQLFCPNKTDLGKEVESQFPKERALLFSEKRESC